MSRKPSQAVARTETLIKEAVIRAEIKLPPAIEKVYRLVREGSCGNLRVQELQIQGDQVLERKFISERDAKPFALARLIGCVEDQVQRDFR